MIKELLLIACCLINGGSKPEPAEKELTLEELRAAEMMEMLEMLDMLMDENFTAAEIAVKTQTEETKGGDKNESGK